jgi:hypothetical protein
MYGLSDYVMALQEVEKARLEYQKSKAHQDENRLNGPPLSPEPGRHARRAPERRLRRVS